MKLRHLIVALILIVLLGFALSCSSTNENTGPSRSEIESMKEDILYRFDYIYWIDMSYSKDDNTLYCEFAISSQLEKTETILKAVYAQLPIEKYDVDLYLGILDSSQNELGYLTCIDGNISVH